MTDFKALLSAACTKPFARERDCLGNRRGKALRVNPRMSWE
jgi:hypothetical protein